jgi:hypothetical protein
MGVGYCVSPLHRIIHFDASPITSRPPVKGSKSPINRVAELTGTNVGVGTPRVYSPTIEDILVWRQGVATKYRDQLEEDLTWDEGSTFEVSEDVATSGDVIFHCVAAVFVSTGVILTHVLPHVILLPDASRTVLPDLIEAKLVTR